MINDDIRQINQYFKNEGFELRLVGGCVRDYLSNIVPHDIDLCTNATPTDMEHIATKYNLKLIPTGIKHGTITFILNDEQYEVTTLRIDTECDGRHADVTFTTDWEADAKRRDFTFNALSMDMDGNVYDYCNGKQDLERQITKFIGNPFDRITEDYLRILRYFRFMGKFETPIIDFQSYNAVKTMFPYIRNVSGERINDEISKILMSHNPTISLTYLNQCNNIDIIPKFKIDNVAFERFHSLKADYVTRLAFHLNSEEQCSIVDETFKLSTNAYKKLLWLVSHKDTPITELQIKQWVNLKICFHLSDTKDYISSLLILTNNQPFIKLVYNIQQTIFPVSGKDLLPLGFRGVDVGRQLRVLTQIWKNSNFTMSKEELLKRR